jgi:ribosomal protein L18
LHTVDDYIEGIALFKREMDQRFSVHRKQERVYHQVISRENNFSMVSNDTDYLICDIDYAKNESLLKDDRVTKEGSQFDMIGIK